MLNAVISYLEFGYVVRACAMSICVILGMHGIIHKLARKTSM